MGGRAIGRMWTTALDTNLEAALADLRPSSSAVATSSVGLPPARRDRCVERRLIVNQHRHLGRCLVSAVASFARARGKLAPHWLEEMLHSQTTSQAMPSATPTSTGGGWSRDRADVSERTGRKQTMCRLDPRWRPDLRLAQNVSARAAPASAAGRDFVIVSIDHRLALLRRAGRHRR
jgi:hypothetical protein